MLECCGDDAAVGIWQHTQLMGTALLLISNDTELHTALTLYPDRLLMLTGVSQRHVLQFASYGQGRQQALYCTPSSRCSYMLLERKLGWTNKFAGNGNFLANKNRTSVSFSGWTGKQNPSFVAGMESQYVAGGVLQVVDMTSSGSWALWMYMTVAQVYKAIITGLCFTSVFICISNSAPNAKKVGCVLGQLLSD